NVHITGPLTLIGDGIASDVTINGNLDVATPGAVTIDGITVNGSITDPGADLTIQNTIINAAGDATDISGANSALIQNNQISSTGGDGVHGDGVTGDVTLKGNAITANRGVWLTNVDGKVTIGGLPIGDGNNVLALTDAGVVLAGGIAGAVTI